VPTESELEEAEIGLLEVFHRSGADRSQVPDIFRRDHRVYFELNMEDAALRAAVIAAAGRSPFTAFYARSTTAGSAIGPMGPAQYSTYPPFIEDLDQYTGGAATSRVVLEQLREALDRLEQPARALSFLAARYPEPVYVRLAASLARRLDSIASDYVAELVQSHADLERLLNPVLNSLAGSDEPDSAERFDSLPRISSWISLGPVVAIDAAGLEQTLAQMFYVRRIAQPEIL